MKTLRRLGVLLLFLVGITLSLASASTFSGRAVDHTLQNTREIAASFQQAKAFIRPFQKQHDRLPTTPEFEAWTHRFPLRAYNPNGMFLKTESFPDEAIAVLGTPPPDGYLLMYWRGEWMEYAASWTERTTLEFDERKFYLLGSKYADSAVLALTALSMLALSTLIWTRRSR